MKKIFSLIVAICLISSVSFAGQQTWSNVDKAKDVLASDGPIADNFDELYLSVLAVTAANGSLISATDTTPGFVNGKLVAGTDIAFAVGSPVGDETLTISLDFSDAEVKTAYENNADTNAYTDTEKANLANTVLKTGVQTIAGVKTFSSFPLTPSSLPTINYQVANKRYIDEEITGTIANLIAAAVLAANPVGEIKAFPFETVPTGYLECNGAAVSRTTYSALFAKTGALYGVGDGSTTFNLPDYRGRFLRGWDHGAGVDPDAATRTDAGDGSTIGDHVGTRQADEFEAHTHPTRPASTYFYNIGSPSAYPSMINNTSGATGSTGGNETRPINVNVMYCIKY